MFLKLEGYKFLKLVMFVVNLRNKDCTITYFTQSKLYLQFKKIFIVRKLTHNDRKNIKTTFFKFRMLTTN